MRNIIMKNLQKYKISQRRNTAWNITSTADALNMHEMSRDKKRHKTRTLQNVCFIKEKCMPCHECTHFACIQCYFRRALTYVRTRSLVFISNKSDPQKTLREQQAYVVQE